MMPRIKKKSKKAAHTLADKGNNTGNTGEGGVPEDLVLGYWDWQLIE